MSLSKTRMSLLIMLTINLMISIGNLKVVLKDMHAPVKELSTKEIKMKSKPWITPNITKLIRNRNKLFKNFIIRKEIKSIEKLKDQIKIIISNILKKIVTILKKSCLLSEKL